MHHFARLLLPVVGLLLAACGTVATPVWSEQAEETRVAQAATSSHLTEMAPTATATLTSTPVPSATFTPTAAPVTATPVPPTATVAPPTSTPAMAAGDPLVYVGPGDPANGAVLYAELKAEVNFACQTCHLPNSEQMLIGPGLLNVAEWAAENITDKTPQEYLHESIVNPGAYVVSGYPDNLMPRTYGELFSEQEIEDLVAYLMSLRS